jgi:hypothetical protein
MRVSQHFKRLGLLWAGILLLIAVFAFFGVKMTTLSVDPLQRLHQPFYLGLLSQLGALLWCTTAAITLFSSLLAHEAKRHASAIGFLRMIGILTILLLIDDLLMIHEVILPQYLHLASESLYLAYGVYMCWLLVQFRHFIFVYTAYPVLIVAGICFAVSLAIDTELILGKTATEDLFKIFGIITYCYYGVLTSAGVVRTSWSQQTSGS